jgi:hypothetical protein
MITNCIARKVTQKDGEIDFLNKKWLDINEVVVYKKLLCSKNKTDVRNSGSRQGKKLNG